MAIKPEAFIALDESLLERLSIEWKAYSRPVLRKLAKAVKAGDGHDIQQVIDSLDLAAIFDPHRDYVEFVGTQSLLFGISRHGSLNQSQFSTQKVETDIVAAAATQLRAMLSAQNRHLHRVAWAQVDKALMAEGEGVVNKAEDPDSEILWDFGTAGAAAIELTGGSASALVTSLHTSRLAQYGFCVEAELRGVENYAINEVLDKRTCAVCQSMNGLVFSVDRVYRRLDRIIRVTDPEELKTIAPWPKQDKASIERMRGMTVSELSNEGWDVPPFHPRCRGYLDVTTAEPQWESTVSELHPS